MKTEDDEQLGRVVSVIEQALGGLPGGTPRAIEPAGGFHPPAPRAALEVGPAGRAESRLQLDARLTHVNRGRLPSGVGIRPLQRPRCSNAGPGG